MPGLARKHVEDEEDMPDARRANQARPEELRILEAILFASSEPVDEKTLSERMPAGVDIKQVRMLPEGGICPARRQPRAHQRQMDFPHRQ